MDKKDSREQTLEFEAEVEKQRLDKTIYERLKGKGISRSKVKEFILHSKVKVDGEEVTRPSYCLRSGQKVVIRVPEEEKGLMAQQGGEVKVLWRDGVMAVIDKPAHLTVHPAPSCKESTLVHYLLSYFPELSVFKGDRPGIVHRLDKDTSGLMLIALKREVKEALSNFFKERKVSKRYIALVWGRFTRERGRIDMAIARDEKSRIKMGIKRSGREAITLYRVLGYFKREDISLVEVKILTGRTHQIRVHMSHIGHPVVGDKVYGRENVHQRRIVSSLYVNRQMLHCWRLDLPHPVSGESLSFICPLPRDMYRAVLKLLSRPLVVGITGNVGSGKSTVAKILGSSRGTVVWSADEAVDKLYKKGETGWEMIRRTFGRRYLDEEKEEIDRTRLLASMSKDPLFRKELMNIIHPLVEGELMEFLSLYGHKRLLVCEIPLLFETGWHKRRDLFDIVLMVYCGNQERIRRLKELRGWSEEQICAIDSWQMTQEEKVRLADIILDNSGDKSDLACRVQTLRTILRGIKRKKLKISLLDLLPHPNMIPLSLDKISHLRQTDSHCLVGK